MCVCSFMSDSAISWMEACQTPLSMEFSCKEYWSGSPFPSTIIQYYNLIWSLHADLSNIPIIMNFVALACCLIQDLSKDCT